MASRLFWEGYSWSAAALPPLLKVKISRQKYLVGRAPALQNQPVAVPAIPFWRRRFSSSGSLVGGRQVLPEQTRALGLSFGRCGSVWRKAMGRYSSEISGVTR